MLQVKNILCVTSKKYFNNSLKYRSNQHQRHQAAMKKANSIPARQYDLHPLVMLRSYSNPSFSSITTVAILWRRHSYHSLSLWVVHVKCSEHWVQNNQLSHSTHQNNSQRQLCFLYILLGGIFSCGDAWGHAQAEAFTIQVHDTGGECIRCVWCIPGCWLQDVWHITGQGKLHQKTLHELQENHHSCEIWAM